MKVRLVCPGGSARPLGGYLCEQRGALLVQRVAPGLIDGERLPERLSIAVDPLGVCVVVVAVFIGLPTRAAGPVGAGGGRVHRIRATDEGDQEREVKREKTGHGGQAEAHAAARSQSRAKRAVVVFRRRTSTGWPLRCPSRRTIGWSARGGRHCTVSARALRHGHCSSGARCTPLRRRWLRCY